MYIRPDTSLDQLGVNVDASVLLQYDMHSYKTQNNHA